MPHFFGLKALKPTCPCTKNHSQGSARRRTFFNPKGSNENLAKCLYAKMPAHFRAPKGNDQDLAKRLYAKHYSTI